MPTPEEELRAEFDRAYARWRDCEARLGDEDCSELKGALDRAAAALREARPSEGPPGG